VTGGNWGVEGEGYKKSRIFNPFKACGWFRSQKHFRLLLGSGRRWTRRPYNVYQKFNVNEKFNVDQQGLYIYSISKVGMCAINCWTEALSRFFSQIPGYREVLNSCSPSLASYVPKTLFFWSII
jgi:hypothetical protein